MFENFTNKTVAAIMIAQQEARNLRQRFVGSELVLVGLMGIGEGIAADVLKKMGLTFPVLMDEVERTIGRGTGAIRAEIPFTPTMKRVFEQAIQEARQLNHNYVAPEHLLLAIAAENDDAAVHILRKLLIEPTDLRGKILQAIKEKVTVPSGRAIASLSKRRETVV
jgi:ATP-dependent Clp protease ATP-binding subunit ClpC